MNKRQEKKLKKFLTKNKIKVVLVARNDWANLGAQYARSLREIGVDAVMFTRNLHRLNYPDQGRRFKSNSKILPYIKEANIVHLLHSQNPIVDINLKGKKVVVSHTGSRYRNKYKEVNKSFNPIVDLSIVGSSLFGKGAKNEHWIPGGVVDTNRLKPIYKRFSDKIIIGHYPSSPKLKGSVIISNIMKNVKGNYIFKYDPKVIKWENNIKRINECDIYIERFTENTGFGIAALEAAALGKIVITTYAFKQKYEETTGEFGLISVKTQKELKEEIERIINLPDNKILKMKKRTREWVEKYHSHEAVGLRLLKIYRKIL